ncbi:protein FLOURY 1-like [Euphorbia lathyris]|uniref:protein FLOURY 1-like n=1 Tax=Euphorbia lathyris TaxID=212925 RepID=UPI0033141E8C
MEFVSCLKLLTKSSELKSGFLLLGCFSPAFNILGLLLMFCLGFKYLQITWQGKGFIQFFYEIRGKSGDENNGLCSKLTFNEVFDSKFIPCWFNSLKFLENSKSGIEGKMLVAREAEDPNDDDDAGSNLCVEDEEFDVMALRRLVKIERYKAEMANLELEKERMASSSAANEAMAMISRLQNEKSSIEIQANQFRRMAEQQQAYDKEVIQSWQEMIMRYESERDELVENLRFCEHLLKLFMRTNEYDGFEDFDLNLNLDADTTGEDEDDDDDLECIS